MRWTVKRKLEILAALQAEITTGGKIEKQHGITAEELSIWIL